MGNGSKLFRIACICGAVPLGVGVIVSVLFYFTQWKWLVAVGLLNIYAGVISVVIGLILLTIYTIRLFKKCAVREKTAVILLGYSLLLVNFPAAVFLAIVSHGNASMSTVVVDNRSLHIIPEVTLTGPSGAQFHISKIPPGSNKRGRFRIKGEGSVTYEVKVGTKTESGILFGYITSGMDQAAKITIDPKSVISVTDLR